MKIVWSLICLQYFGSINKMNLNSASIFVSRNPQECLYFRLPESTTVPLFSSPGIHNSASISSRNAPLFSSLKMHQSASIFTSQNEPCASIFSSRNAPLCLYFLLLKCNNVALFYSPKMHHSAFISPPKMHHSAFILNLPGSTTMPLFSPLRIHNSASIFSCQNAPLCL